MKPYALHAQAMRNARDVVRGACLVAMSRGDVWARGVQAVCALWPTCAWNRLEFAGMTLRAQRLDVAIRAAYRADN